MSASPEARAALAAQQAELLAALVAGGPVPAGFDGDRVRIQAAALEAKRRRVAAAKAAAPMSPEAGHRLNGVGRWSRARSCFPWTSWRTR